MPTDPRHEEFMRLFLSCQPRIFAFIRSLVFSRTDADDVLQETALVLWEKFDQFEPGTHFDRWAYRVAHFQVRAFRQSKARDRLQFSDGLVERLAAEIVSQGDHLEASHQALTQCLAKLADGDRNLIHERYRPDRTNREVAHATGRSESMISRTLNRIRTALLFCIEVTLAQKEAQNIR